MNANGKANANEINGDFCLILGARSLGTSTRLLDKIAGKIQGFCIKYLYKYETFVFYMKASCFYETFV